MDKDQTVLSDTSILDSSIDSVDSVVQKQIERNKRLAKQAANVSDSPPVTGGNKNHLGPPRQSISNTLHTEQFQNDSLDDTVDLQNNISISSLTDKFNGTHVAEPSKPTYLSPTDIVQHFNELNMTRQKDLCQMQKTLHIVLKHVARLEKDPPDEIKKLDAQLQKAEQSSEKAFESQELGLQIAKEVASYYSTPIEVPQGRPEPKDWKPLINYKSPREITAALRWDTLTQQRKELIS